MIALGAVHALQDRHLGAEEKVRRALEAAESFSAGVRGPFVVLEVAAGCGGGPGLVATFEMREQAEPVVRWWNERLHPDAPAYIEDRDPGDETDEKIGLVCMWCCTRERDMKCDAAPTGHHLIVDGDELVNPSDEPETHAPSEAPYMLAIGAVERGYAAWAAKPHNRKWVKRIEGTPIPNDLRVCIAEQVARTTPASPSGERCRSCNASSSDPCAYPTENARRLRRQESALRKALREIAKFDSDLHPYPVGAVSEAVSIARRALDAHPGDGEPKS